MLSNAQLLAELNNNREVTVDLVVRSGNLNVNATITGIFSIRNSYCRLESETGDFITFSEQAVKSVRLMGEDSGLIKVEL